MTEYSSAELSIDCEIDVTDWEKVRDEYIGEIGRAHV